VPLGPTPYAPVIAARARDANGCLVLTIHVQDAAGALRGSASLTLCGPATPQAIRAAADQLVMRHMVADAGSPDAVLDTLIARGAKL
jgi:hypothetical protein